MNSETFEMYRRPQPLVLPELVSLGVFRTSEVRLGGVRTDGQDGLEVGYLEHGSVEWWTADRLEEAGPNSLMIDRPGEWQGGKSAIVHPCRRYWLRFRFPPEGTLPGLSASRAADLATVYASMARRHFPASPGMLTLFEQLVAQQRAPADFAEEMSRALFHQILFGVVRDYRRDQAAVHSPAVRRALGLFGEHLDQDFRTEEVASRVGLSTGYFHDLFLREVGVTPAQFHLRLRISAAKRALIGTEETITQIAMSLGFSSSQYFSTAFRKVVGLTPTDYRQLRHQALASAPSTQHPGLPSPELRQAPPGPAQLAAGN